MTRPATEQHQVCDCGSCGPRNDDTATTARGSRASRADLTGEPPGLASPGLDELRAINPLDVGTHAPVTDSFGSVTEVVVATIFALRGLAYPNS